MNEPTISQAATSFTHSRKARKDVRIDQEINPCLLKGPAPEEKGIDVFGIL